MQTVPASPGDVFLLCSDGLTTMVDEERIAAVLSDATSMREAVRALVDEANRAGGRDNITALAFRLEDAAAPLRDAAGGRDVGRRLSGGGRADRDRGAPPRRRRGGPGAPREAGGDAATPRRLRRAAKALAVLAVLVALVAAAPGTAAARSGSSAPTTAAASRSTAASPTSCPSGSSSTTSATPARSRPRRCRPAPRSGHRPRPALPLRRGLADRRDRTQPGGSLRSARNRELVALVPVALLLTAGFAAVFAQEGAAARQPQPRSTAPTSSRSASPPTSTCGCACPTPTPISSRWSRC